MCIPDRFTDRKFRLVVLFLAIATFIPVLGILLNIFAIIAFNFYSKNYKDIEISSIEQQQLGSEKVTKISSYAEGWAYVRLVNSLFPTKEKKLAQYAINKKFTKQVNDINRLLLSDNADEIRLYAFNILNKQQNTITKSIRQYLEVQKNSHSILESAKIDKILASLYWEYIYLNLNPGQLSEEILNKSLFHTNRALKTLSSDADLWFLLAKIYKECNQIDKCKNALETASQLQNPPSEIYLYLAAISYDVHDYAMVKSYLKKIVNAYDVSTNASIVKFWCKNENELSHS
jgi:hypothetical protein